MKYVRKGSKRLPRYYGDANSLPIKLQSDKCEVYSSILALQQCQEMHPGTAYAGSKRSASLYNIQLGCFRTQHTHYMQSATTSP